VKFDFDLYTELEISRITRENRDKICKAHSKGLELIWVVRGREK
jgi:hypothetical protein